MSNFIADLPADLSEEVFETLITGGKFRVERIVSFGHTSTAGFWYDQLEAEWVMLLRGAARLRFADDDNETVEMKPGDVVNIPAHRRHRVEWTAPNEATVWLAIHYTP